MMLRARPDAIEQVDTVPLLIKVAVSVARKVSRPVGDVESTCHILTWILGGANVGLLIANAKMLRPELRAGRQTHTGLMSEIDHLLVESFGVHIDLDRTTRATKRFEESLPEAVTSFRNATLAVNAKSDAFDLRTQLQQFSESVPAINGMGF